MNKFLTDMHTHSDFSFDAKAPLKEMLKAAYEKGLAFYGVSEHFNYDVTMVDEKRRISWGIDEEAYFHTARHLQEDYEGCMNVLIGAEFGFSTDKAIQAAYRQTYEKYRPDFVINSIHCLNGEDYYEGKPYGVEKPRSKEEVYGEYLDNVFSSLHAEYPYDIVGHIGYPTRYAPYEDKEMSLSQFQDKIDKIFLEIIRLDKILEVNSSNKGGVSRFLPSDELIARYFALGGRKISYGSDTHTLVRIADKREEVAAFLKEVGFTHLTIPCRGEHVKVEL